MSFTRKTLLLDSREGYSVANNSHAVNFTLLEPIDNLTKVKFTSFEYCNFIPNVRSNGLDTFNVFLTDASGNNMTVESYTIPTKNYTDIADVITALNASFSASLPNGITAMAVELYQDIYIRMRYTLGFGSNRIVRPLCDTPFSQELLGFNKLNDWTVVAGSPVYIISKQPCNLSFDTYIQIDIPNLTSHPVLSSGTSKPIRLPLMSNYGEAMFLSTSNGLHNQMMETQLSNSKITTLQVRFYDRFGNPLTNVRTGSWSATVELYLAGCKYALDDANI